MLAAPRVDRQSQWGILDGSAVTTASTPGEDLPPIPSNMHELSRVGSLPMDSPTMQMLDRTSTIMSMKSNAGPSRFIGNQGGSSMERQQSAGGSIADIEWVDWYDCYKGYKNAKIRAEAEAAKRAQEDEESPLGDSRSAFDSSPNSAFEHGDGRSPQQIELASNFGSSSAIALSPTTSRDDFAALERGSKRRSMSIQSAMMNMDPTLSTNLKRSNVFERPRQTSGSSMRSNAESTSSSTGTHGTKKKKNLVTKMEGWWNAVKSNFIPDDQQPPQQLAHRPLRPSNLGQYPSHRVPSAPASRRGSDLSPISTPQPALLGAKSMSRESSHSVRQATSVIELRSRTAQQEAHGLHTAGPMVKSTSADIAHLSKALSMGVTPAPVMGRASSNIAEETSKYLSRVPSSLETRRKGQGAPKLRLDLESNVMARPESMRTDSSSSGDNLQSRLPAHIRSTNSSSRTSSYGLTMLGPGLTPGVPKWDQTPSPIYPISAGSRGDKEDRPVAPGAEISVASVRRHIKHRLEAAKEICDNTLRKSINAMTRFAEEQKAQQTLQGEYDDQPLDYFDAISDSPLVDAEESEAEGGEVLEDGHRSRQGKSDCYLKG